MNTNSDATPALDTTARAEVLNTLLVLLHQHYVFPKVAQEMESALRLHMSNGDYEQVTSSEQFAQLLTTHLQEVSKDKHLHIFYRAEELPEHKEQESEQQQKVRWHEYWRAQNYGFQKVERLPGNIGYLDFRAFYPPEYAGETAIAAMNFLANTSALIVDMRYNHGGYPEMIALITSYLFSSEPVHLNDLYWRDNDSTQQFWTLSYVPGQRYGNKPVYVLTSHETFSGGEEFTYNLKNLKRATIIGEVTGGGAHPGGVQRINAHFEVFIPGGRAISPITNTNWEGTGVTPDIDVPQTEALLTAQKLALKKILEDIGDNPEGAQKAVQKEAQKALQELDH